MATKAQRDVIRRDPIALAIYRRALGMQWRCRSAYRLWGLREKQPPAGHDHRDWV
ncbi:hypothetical protein D3C87_820870 [compost metagenome]